jgi:hypothetical protein
MLLASAPRRGKLANLGAATSGLYLVPDALYVCQSTGNLTFASRSAKLNYAFVGLPAANPRFEQKKSQKGRCDDQETTA